MPRRSVPTAQQQHDHGHNEDSKDHRHHPDPSRNVTKQSHKRQYVSSWTCCHGFGWRCANVDRVSTASDPLGAADWGRLVATHRSSVQTAILDAVAALIEAHGLTRLTMSEVAKRAGIGRATLYRHFADIDALVHAWHDRVVETHLAELVQLATDDAVTEERLRSVAARYAEICLERASHATQTHPETPHTHPHALNNMVGPVTGQGAPATVGQSHLRAATGENVLAEVFADLLRRGAADGTTRQDVPARELALYCLNALGAAAQIPSPAGRRRLVEVVIASTRVTAPVAATELMPPRRVPTAGEPPAPGRRG